MSFLKGGFLAWFLLTLSALALALDRVTPDRFIHVWLWIILLASLVVSFLIVIIKKKIYISLSLSGNQKFVILAAIVLLMVAGSYFTRTLNNKSLLAAANDDFDTIIHGAITQKQVDYTMLQLEKGLKRIIDSSGIDPARISVIRVELYPDLVQLQRITGLEHWASGFTLYGQDGPVIHIPVVVDESGINETPEHEVVHAVMYQKAGDQIGKLPLWFKEGVAQYISEMGFFKLLSRDTTRLQLWSDKDSLFTTADFKTYSPDDSAATEKEIRLFYDSADEFIRYLTDVYGFDLPWRIADAVTGGSSFEQTLAGVTGTSFEGCYSDWQKTFWGTAAR
jgi:hypothetical protein